jgi:hypothetical protein
MRPTPFLAQENFTGLFAFLVAIFVLISLISLVFSARGRWYGPVMTFPGLLFSCSLTGALFNAMKESPDVHWEPGAILLFSSPPSSASSPSFSGPSKKAAPTPICYP